MHCICSNVLWSFVVVQFIKTSLREKCLNTEFLLVGIFPHSDWIRRDTENLSVFSSNVEKYRPEKTRIWTPFTHCINVVLHLQRQLHHQRCIISSALHCNYQNSQEDTCARFEACNSIKKETLVRVFSYGFCKTLMLQFLFNEVAGL